MVLGEGGTPLCDLEKAVASFISRDEREVDSKRLRVLIDTLEVEFSLQASRERESGRHLVEGSVTAVSWLSRCCRMSATSAAERICVGEQLNELPLITEALRTGQVSYQSTVLLCHLRARLEDQKELFVEEEMLEHAKQHSVHQLRYLCRLAYHEANPDAFFNESEASYTRRRLQISQFADGMFALDGLLDPEGGAALRSALDSLAKPLGPDDDRSHKQRLADALVECTNQALESGRLPRRHGAKPHLNVSTTLEGLKSELGAPAADLELSLPISTRTVERIACDRTFSRVLLADSAVIDVGRATRVVSAPTRRALRNRDRGCRFPGCDRRFDWSSPHHIIAWSKHGPTNLSNLVLLCYFHHRMVHEGGWQVIKEGREFRFLPPERVVFRRARGPGLRWAA
jgi:hypothetical protein